MSSPVCARWGIALVLGACVLLSAGCASSGKKSDAAAASGAEVEVTTLPGSERDALGNYRFTMQQEGQKMSADQFDAWMQANGIRVATGKPVAAPVAVASKDKPKARPAKTK
ncbi:MAG: hypothetical protein ACOH1V_10965 [Stenotrophomonas sp.]